MAGYFYDDKKENISDYAAVILFILAGSLAMIAFGNFVMFFIGIEILSVSLYILVGSNKKEMSSNEAAFKYFLLGSVVSGILLMGITFIYAITGSFDLSEIAQVIENQPNNILLQVGVVLVIIAILFKASTVPFQFWAPDVYEGAPILTTAQMSTLVKVAILAAFFKLLSTAFLPMLFFIAPILAIISALTMIVGNLSAFKQNNVKRLLAFSGISHAGFMLMTLLNPTKGSYPILFYATVYSLASIAIFSIAIPLFKQTKNPDISSFDGLAKKHPIVAFLVTISFLSMAGIPPLAGFWAKYYLFIDIFKDYLWLVIIAILNSAASIFVYFKFIWAMYTKEDGNAQKIEIPMIYFFVLIFGESHGVAIGGVIDGCPAGIEVNLDKIQFELDRRKPGQSAIVTQRKESDMVQFLSGIFENKTTGVPIGFIIPNENHHSKDYNHLKDNYRPSHADFVYDQKYGHRDYKGGGRSSARETAARIVAGAIAKQVLQNVEFYGYVSAVGNLQLNKSYQELDLSSVEDNIVRCPDQKMAEKMINLIKKVRKEGDTIGGIVTCVIKNVPIGLGDPVFDKLHAKLGQAMLSINAVKGFEYGSGFSSIKMKGSEHNDWFNSDHSTKTNYSGGIQGGISNGMDIYFNVAFKPVPTIMLPQESIDKYGNKVIVEGKGRHDPCVVPRAVPIVEAMAA
ncbi:unnamed protein product, partial [Darwinula stevensoni]